MSVGSDTSKLLYVRSIEVGTLKTHSTDSKKISRPVLWQRRVTRRIRGRGNSGSRWVKLVDTTPRVDSANTRNSGITGSEGEQGGEHKKAHLGTKTQQAVDYGKLDLLEMVSSTKDKLVRGGGCTTLA